MSLYSLMRPLLFRLPAERAHDWSLAALDRLPLPWAARRPELPVRALGREFPNPVGLAAGMDKDGDHIDALAGLGFGFLELGTVTPRPQPGNPQPRLFRLPAANALINRMGFNNRGVDHLVARIEASRFYRDGGIVGVNIGKNRDTPNERAVEDYLICLRRAHRVARYITINLSSPNTHGLRELQQADALRAMLEPLAAERQRLESGSDRAVPLLLKIAPDLDTPALEAIAGVAGDGLVDGIICTNTTTDRSAVAGLQHGDESGGLSGAPLLQPANRVLAAMRALLPAMPLIGVGGILGGADAAAKLDAGADLVQIYTGMIYRGPALIGECVEALRRRAA